MAADQNRLPYFLEELLYNSSVSDLSIVVLVEERSDDIVNKLVFGVGHIHGKGDNKADKNDKNNFAENFERDFEILIHL